MTDPVVDPVVEAVRQDLHARSQRGLLKYGVSLGRSDLRLTDWLQHLYEELLDAALYVKRSIMTLRGDLPAADSADVADTPRRNWLGREVKVPMWFLLVISWGFFVTSIHMVENSEIISAFMRGLKGG